MIEDYWVGSLHFSEPFGDDTLARLNALPPIQARNGKPTRSGRNMSPFTR